MVYQRKRLKLEEMGDEAVFLSEYDKSLTLRTTMQYRGVREFAMSEDEMIVLRDMLNVKLDWIEKDREMAAFMREAAARADRAKLATQEPDPGPPPGLPEF